MTEEKSFFKMQEEFFNTLLEAEMTREFDFKQNQTLRIESIVKAAFFNADRYKFPFFVTRATSSGLQILVSSPIELDQLLDRI